MLQALWLEAIDRKLQASSFQTAHATTSKLATTQAISYKLRNKVEGRGDQGGHRIGLEGAMGLECTSHVGVLCLLFYDRLLGLHQTLVPLHQRL